MEGNSMNANGCIALSGLAMLFFFGGGAAEEPLASSQPSVLLAEKLRSEDMEGRTAAWGRVRSARETTIAALLHVARAKEQDLWTKLRRSQAIELLGEYRAVAAVDLLIEEIEAPPGHGWVDGPEPSRKYPSVHALIKVGEPAITRILAVRTAKPMTERELKLFSYVIWIYYVPLEEQEVGLFRMERLLAIEKDSMKHAAEETGMERPMGVREKNLTQLIEVYKAIGPGGPRDWPKQR